MDRVTGGGSIDDRHEPDVRRGDLIAIAGVGRFAQSALEGLDLRAVAQVLEPLPGSGPNALRLLLGVGHGRRRW